MTVRHRLPSRRNSEAVTYECAGVGYRALFSRAANGQPAELFLNAGKEGTAASVIAKECAVTLSIVQYGTPLQTIYEALPKDQDGAACGPLGMAIELIQPPTHEGK